MFVLKLIEASQKHDISVKQYGPFVCRLDTYKLSGTILRISGEGRTSHGFYIFLEKNGSRWCNE